MGAGKRLVGSNKAGELLAGVLVPDITERKRADEELQTSRVL